MLKSKIAPHIVEIVASLQDAGYETYIVGGAVRDFLIGRKPKDYDISTAAEPEQIQEIFGRRRALVIGRRFRLVQLRHGEELIEVSTFRQAPSKDNQTKTIKGKVLPENMIFHDNEFGTSEEDAWRRDFTVNAIFYDPVKDKIVDYTGKGVDDLKAGLVRAIGDAKLRFEEDPVRILRALKLVGQYGFSLEEGTSHALSETINLIEHSSPSRLSLELEKILKNPYSEKIFEAFYKYGFLRYFLPFLHKEWNTHAGHYVQQILAEKNRRVIEGHYRVSVSLTIAAIALPFIEEAIGTGHGELWQNFMGIEESLKKYISRIFNPRIFTKRLLASSLKTLTLQPKLFHCIAPQKLIHSYGYSHARELLIVQNNLIWNDPKFPEIWPSRLENPRNTSRHFGRFRKKRFHR